MPLNGNFFKVSFKRLTVWLLPKPRRKPVYTAWLLALGRPVVALYGEFLQFRMTVLYFLTINPQVCRLEKLLNDRYDTVLRRIVIEDAVEVQPIFLYRKIEAKPAYLHRRSEGKPVLLYTKAETGVYTVDFVIKVPVFVVVNVDEMRSLVKRFKLASKTFKIVYV